MAASIAIDRVKEILDKIPIGLLLICYAGYMGYDYFSYTHDASSPLLSKQAEIQQTRDSLVKLQSKVKQMNEFVKTLDAKRTQIRQLAQDLEGMKGTLSETLDVPEFMKTIITEAKRVGLTVVSLSPTGEQKKEYYAEETFDFKFKGVYVQLMVFLDRLANMQNIIRVDNFSVHPISSGISKYVELEGTVEIKAYRYLTSKADELGRDKSNDSGASGKPAQGGGAKGAGGGDR